MADPIARHPFQGNANYSVTLPNAAIYLVLFNDGNADISFKAGTFSGVVRAGGAFDEKLDPFTHLEITATSNYSGYFRFKGGN